MCILDDKTITIDKSFIDLDGMLCTGRGDSENCMVIGIAQDLATGDYQNGTKVCNIYWRKMNYQRVLHYVRNIMQDHLRSKSSDWSISPWEKFSADIRDFCLTCLFFPASCFPWLYFQKLFCEIQSFSVHTDCGCVSFSQVWYSFAPAFK